MHRVIIDAVILSPNRGRMVGCSCCRALWGMASGVAVVLGSFRMCPCPVAPVGGVVIAVGRNVLRV